MLNFSRWTPTLGVCFKWDSQKVLKIAHIGIFRHIGGVRWVRKITDIKILWVKVLHAKNGDFSTTRGWEINFFRQNIGMFERLCTQTYEHFLNFQKPYWPYGALRHSLHDWHNIYRHPSIKSYIHLSFFFLLILHCAGGKYNSEFLATEK